MNAKTIAVAVVAAAGMIALPAHAYHYFQGHELVASLELKDGSIVHVFEDGKMGMEDRYGRAAVMPEGTEMETKDGKKVIMKGNEVWRVESIYYETYGGGG